MKQLLLIQPGAFGDIFICAPIAKYYADNGYQVDWAVTEKFSSVLESFPYVNIIPLDNELLHPDWLKSDVIKCLELAKTKKYDKVLNLADRGPHPTAQQFQEKFDVCKYRIAEVPIAEKTNLSWKRDLIKEQELFTLINPLQPYVVAAVESSHGDTTEIPDTENRKVVYIKQVDGFNIVDWFTIIEGASAVYAVESAVQCFIEGCGSAIKGEKFLLKRSSIHNNIPYTHSPSWNLNYFK